jgi:hypothetical protein
MSLARTSIISTSSVSRTSNNGTAIQDVSTNTTLSSCSSAIRRPAAKSVTESDPRDPTTTRDTSFSFILPLTITRGPDDLPSALARSDSLVSEQNDQLTCVARNPQCAPVNAIATKKLEEAPDLLCAHLDLSTVDSSGNQMTDKNRNAIEIPDVLDLIAHRLGHCSTN